MTAPTATITVPEALPLARHIQEREATMCCVHICLSDPNDEDSHAAFCLEHARERGHGDCETMAALLVRMSRTQRKRLRQELWART